MTASSSDLVSLTADIVSAHISHNDVATADLGALIASAHAALVNARAPPASVEVKAEPAVPIRSSVKLDYIVCLEDGKKLKMLKRYLRTNFDMSPDDYRAKWNLPRDYPMVAPAYAEKRKELAVKIGLGRRPAAVVEAAPEKSETPAKRRKLGIAAAKAAAAAHLGGDQPA